MGVCAVQGNGGQHGPSESWLPAQRDHHCHSYCWHFSHPSSPSALCSSFPELITICEQTTIPLIYTWLFPLPGCSYILTPLYPGGLTINATASKEACLDHPKPPFCASMRHILDNPSPKHGVLTLPSYPSVNSMRAGIVCASFASGPQQCGPVSRTEPTIKKCTLKSWAIYFFP